MLFGHVALVLSLALVPEQSPKEIMNDISAQIEQLKALVGDRKPKLLTKTEQQTAITMYNAIEHKIDKSVALSPKYYNIRILKWPLRQLKDLIDIELEPSAPIDFIDSNIYVESLKKVFKRLHTATVHANDEYFDPSTAKSDLGVPVLNTKELSKLFLKHKKPIWVYLTHSADIESGYIRIVFELRVFEIHKGKPVFCISDWANVYLRQDCQSHRFYFCGMTSGGI